MNPRLLKKLNLHRTLLLLLLLYQGCIEDLEKCSRRNGKMVELSYELPSIRGIEANDGINIFLYSSDEQKVIARAGEHVISQLELEVKEGILILQDNNKCNWSRQYQDREVHLYLPELVSINQNGYGSILSSDTIVSDQIRIAAQGGSGNIDLMIKTKHLDVYSWRYGTIKIAGATETLNVQFHNNNAIFDARNLATGQASIIHKSNNSFHLRAKKTLIGNLRAKGDLFLYTKPDVLDVNISGSGKIIPVYQAE